MQSSAIPDTQLPSPAALKPPCHAGIVESPIFGPWGNFVATRGLDMVEEDAFREWLAGITPANQMNVLYEYWLREVPQPADR